MGFKVYEIQLEQGGKYKKNLVEVESLSEFYSLWAPMKGSCKIQKESRGGGKLKWQANLIF